MGAGPTRQIYYRCIQKTAQQDDLSAGIASSHALAKADLPKITCRAFSYGYRQIWIALCRVG